WAPSSIALAMGSGPISSAVYSFGCVLVFAGFCDGAIGIFEAKSLTFRCRIAPSAYIPSLLE
ncbi:hypothetical protein, partial [Klebsiella aerogenes]|uniref:hypothetical protein n=1 Tax=Klebsiella aerogenes TaxID=548 RepID=UPI00195371AB